ncbi:MAG: type II toxin-antitoxin system RelE/ParE family toxin [Candidatus Omnitrophota bacterium]
MSYTLIIKPAPDRVLESIVKPLRSRILKRIASLSNNPRPAGVKKLKGVENRWSLRMGNFRIIYEIHDDRLVILVIDIDHRRQVYR